jgi:hypothetical protein
VAVVPEDHQAAAVEEEEEGDNGSVSIEIF